MFLATSLISLTKRSLANHRGLYFEEAHVFTPRRCVSLCQVADNNKQQRSARLEMIVSHSVEKCRYELVNAGVFL